MAGVQERGRGDARRSSSPRETSMRSTNSASWTRSRTAAAREYQPYHHHSSYETYAPPYSTYGSSNPSQPLLSSPLPPHPSPSSSSSLAASFQTPHPGIPPSRRRDSVFQPRGDDAELAQDLARPPVFHSRSFPISQHYAPSLRGRGPTPPPQSAFPVPRTAPLPQIPFEAQGYTLVSPQLPPRHALPLPALSPPPPPRRAGSGTQRRHTYDGGGGGDEPRYEMPPRRSPAWRNGSRALGQGRERHGGNSRYDRDPRSSSPPSFVPPSPSRQAAAWEEEKEEKEEKKRDNDDDEKGWYYYVHDDMSREIVDDEDKKEVEEGEGKEGEGEEQAGPIHEGISSSPRINLLNTPAPGAVHRAMQGRMSIANLLCQKFST
ncbi:hypothetical protein F4809DRAFT_637123 [Biscogniauxia mediterranea]|nr:hypothetical protein F4809DRAFT_637123 [Biscogniauxia mediterranea]